MGPDTGRVAIASWNGLVVTRSRLDAVSLSVSWSFCKEHSMVCSGIPVLCKDNSTQQKLLNPILGLQGDIVTAGGEP